MALLPKRKKASNEQGRKKDKYIQGAKKKAWKHVLMKSYLKHTGG